MQRARDLARERKRFFDRQLTLAIELGAERLAPHERLHVPEEVVRLTRINQREDVRVIELRGDFDFIEEPHDAEV